MKPRPNELTAVNAREFFEEFPRGADNTPENRARWLRFRIAYNLAADFRTRGRFPLQVDVELNSQCNMRCSFCLHGSTKVAPAALPREAFDAVLSEAQRHGLCSMKFNYINEPLLVDGLAQYLLDARRHGVLSTFFATNGLRLTPDVAEDLIEARVSKVMISLDATTPETFEAVRGSKRLRFIEDNILNLLATRRRLGVDWPRVRVNFLRNALNAHEADDFIEKWTDVADAIGFQTEVAVPGVEAPLYRDEEEAEPFRCAFPWKQVVVDSSGSILPCCTFSGRSLALGRVGEISIAEAWASMAALQDLHRDGRGKENDVCRHCITGGCP